VANHKSAVKRARQNTKRQERNRSRKAEVTTAVKKVRLALESKDKTLAKGLLVKAQSLIDRLAKIGIIKRTTAGRHVSRLSAQVTSLK